jgi:hypothetical protein
LKQSLPIEVIEFGNMTEIKDEHPSKQDDGSEIKELDENEKKEVKVRQKEKCSEF